MLVEWFGVDLILGAWKLVNIEMAEDWRLLLFDDQKSDGMRRGRKAPLYLTKAFFEKKRSCLALTPLALLSKISICYSGLLSAKTDTRDR